MKERYGRDWQILCSNRGTDQYTRYSRGLNYSEYKIRWLDEFVRKFFRILDIGDIVDYQVYLLALSESDEGICIGKFTSVISKDNLEKILKDIRSQFQIKTVKKGWNLFL